jgi:hypothetical protein
MEHPLIQETLNYTEYSVQYVQYGKVCNTQRSIKVLWGMFTHPTAMGKTRMDQWQDGQSARPFLCG